MPRPCDIPAYSREATIKTIQSYYDFLTKLYLPDSAVIRPPASGWPSITPERFRGFGKTEEVISLLAHLPYIEEPSDDNLLMQGAAYAIFCDYHNPYLDRELAQEQAEGLRITTEGLLYERVPPHIVGLVVGGRESPVFLLDTMRGIVHWTNAPSGPREFPTREQVNLDESEDEGEDVEEEQDEEEEEEESWEEAAGPAWAISDFFELLKDEFRNLSMVPLNERRVIDIYTKFGPDEDGMVEMVRGIYRDHGWPDVSVYRKEDCLPAVKKALKERYPDYAWDCD